MRPVASLSVSPAAVIARRAFSLISYPATKAHARHLVLHIRARPDFVAHDGDQQVGRFWKHKFGAVSGHWWWGANGIHIGPRVLGFQLSGEVATKAEAVETVRVTWEKALAWSEETGLPLELSRGYMSPSMGWLGLLRPRQQDRRAHQVAAIGTRDEVAAWMRLTRSTPTYSRRNRVSGTSMIDRDRLATELLAIATENAELRIQLAEAQDQCVELAVDGGELHAEAEALRAKLLAVERERDAWRAEAERFTGCSRQAG